MSAVDDILAGVTDQLGKAKGEIVAKIDELQAQVAAGQPPSQDTLDALKAAAQALDDIVPDVPSEDAPEEPVEG